MTYTTKKFEVNAENMAYYLDLPIDIEIDYWTTKHDGNLITWSDNVIHNEEGIKGFIPMCESILVTFYWRVSVDDISWTQQAMLKHRFDAFESGEFIEGQFMIYTITTRDKDWKIDFSIEFNGVLQPQEVNFNFLDRKIEVI